MTPRIVVTGTDTDIGKTVFSAGLAGFLQASYWKPVQAGLDGGTDSSRVAALSGLPPQRILPERFRLNTPASPHLAAQIDGVRIELDALDVPQIAGSLVIEGAGGLMVPLNSDTLYIDVFARWNLPVVLCARTALGTINHALLSVEALRRRGIPICGIAFIGDDHRDSEDIICAIGQVRRLGRLPRLDPLDRHTLQAAFKTSFNREDFTS
ncbi:dethiobiotin synthase [Rhodopseudomonas palustris]|uniref:ATP-dependent dethiobiotin synthetase BioD n=1 Tax=Rhodopseudomonas palustris (strain BisB18) TaxID=316056 RepID=BIOD_RHOPB|nr:RecName: Full=ATP-dependent dethiobiotin synthetase BioD; AltName: Full=DTB synthetase; Short=DTBS; AltName: Full=Dethiobiotin synthase [Rhodopseudomonas palustris BisB18]